MPQRLPSPEAETPLLAWLLAAWPGPGRAQVKAALAQGRILVNGRAVTHHAHPVRPGDEVAVGPRVPVQPAAGFPLLFDGGGLLAVDKPAGLLSVATESETRDTAFARLAASLKPERPYGVHRLDRDTSGVLLFARTKALADQLQAAWDGVTKRYLAIVDGTPASSGVIEGFLAEGRDLRVRVVPAGHPGAKRAETRYRVLAARGSLRLLEVTLVTGRKHQIRAHLASRGWPVLGDALYGASPAPRLALHAWRVTLPHPATGGPLTIEAAYPAALARVVALPADSGDPGRERAESLIEASRERERPE